MKITDFITRKQVLVFIMLKTEALKIAIKTVCPDRKSFDAPQKKIVFYDLNQSYN